ncbi:hypothetical protein MJT46_007559 [Ovis ammon polii x Ovis aries]|nr:hypothetical protein MJT46_007559 [Ovis ammon polii x Ovis aries]
MPHEDQPSLQRPRYGSIVDDERLSAEEMDERRRQNIAYEYLCHLEEAKSRLKVLVGIYTFRWCRFYSHSREFDASFFLVMSGFYIRLISRRLGSATVLTGLKEYFAFLLRHQKV